jgi:hypothetical protein
LLVNNGVFILCPLEGQELVLVAGCHLGVVVTEILDNFLVSRWLCFRKRPLQVWVAVM